MASKSKMAQSINDENNKNIDYTNNWLNDIKYGPILLVTTNLITLTSIYNYSNHSVVNE